MHQGADVRSIDALRDARAAVAEYRETASLAVAEAVADAQRATHWITVELKGRWQSRIKQLTRKLNHLKSELARAELQAQGSMVSTREERKAVARCQDEIRHAEERLARIRSWTSTLEREFMLFKGHTQNLSRLVEGDLVRGEALLELSVRRLEEYLTPQQRSRGDAPSTRPADDDRSSAAASAGGTDAADASSHRPGEASA